MRFIVIILILGCTASKPIESTNYLKLVNFAKLIVQPKAYYFSASGNDSETVNSKCTPWQNILKLNGLINQGDSILFKRGDEFTGNIEINLSGITVDAYGYGAKPILSGFTTLNFWTQSGNNFESINNELEETVNLVTINGKQVTEGRYPNNSFLKFESHTGLNSITDNELSTNWQGAEIVVKPKRWVLDRATVTNQTGGKITFTPVLTYDPYDNYGYFFQNDIRTLDTTGEWYYNPSQKKISVNGLKAGDIVQASTKDILVSIHNQSNITFENISFQGANERVFDLYSANNIKILNCDFSFSGIDVIWGSSVMGLDVENCTFANTNNNVINLTYNCHGTIIKNNTIKNTGMIMGAGQGGSSSYTAVLVIGKNNLIQGNTIDSTGFTAIKFIGDSNSVIRNLVSNFTLVKDDGGGINTGSQNNQNFKGSRIIENIVMNGIGISEGTDRPGTASSNGIYLDDNSNQIYVAGNTVANCGNAGIIMHNAYAITLSGNTLYNNFTQLMMIHDIAMPSALLRNNVISNNILFSKLSLHPVLKVATMAEDINLLGIMDNNYYCRPIDNNLIINVSFTSSAGKRIDQLLTFNQWKSTYALDINSTLSPVTLPLYVGSVNGSNQFVNGTFDANIKPLYSSASGLWDAGSFKGTNQTGTFYAIAPIGGGIKANKNYMLRFDVRSSKDTIMKAWLRLNASPYTRLSDTKVFLATTLKKTVEVLFILPAPAANAAIMFETRLLGQTFWLDNLELAEADVIVTNPDEHIRFEYNNSSATKNIFLDKNYKEVNGSLFNGILAPYSSKILIY